MAIEEGLVALFKAESSITSLLSGATAIAIDTIDQHIEYAHLSLSLISTDPMKTLTETSGLRNAEVDVDCCDLSKVNANDIADAIESYFNDFTGTAGDHTIEAVLLNDRTTDKFVIGQASQKIKYVTTLNYTIFYT